MSDSSSNGEHAPEVKAVDVESSVRAIDHHNAEPTYEMHSRSSQLKGTDADEHDMEVLGRKQQLNRNFEFISILGFACTLMSTWEITLVTSEYGLINGGTAGLVWGYLIVWAAYAMIFASIAEMASMAPTSGGQYHYVSEFAPRKYQRFLSYLTGWISVVGWQVGCASLAFLNGTVVQGLLVLNNPNYIPENWQGTLLVIAFVAFAIIFNTFLAKKLPMIEGMVLIMHLVGFFAVLLTLWVLGPRDNANDVFTNFENSGGWSSTGVSVLVGTLTPVYSLIGSDSAVHMSEEIRDASRVLPKAMMWAVGINGLLGWIMLITFCFTLGSIDNILTTPTLYPFMQVFYNVTNSNAGASVLTAILIISMTSAEISTVATVSRQTWSFARDRGLPFSNFVSYVKPGWNIPLNSVMITFLVTVLLSLINLGSSVAFNAIGSLCVTALMSSYIISIGCVVAKRLRKEPLPTRRWSLGSYGIWVNAGALLFLSVIWIFTMFPIMTPVTPTTMNWNSVMFAGFMMWGVVYYFVYDKTTYVGPVGLVRRNL